MSDFNTITMSGRLTGDPIVRGSGEVAVLPLASNRQYPKDTAPDGWAQEVCFIDATCFGHNAKKSIAKLVKGDAVFVTGRLELNQYEAQDGSKRRVHRIVVSQVESPALSSSYTRSFGIHGDLPMSANVPPVTEQVPVGVATGTEDDIPF